MQCIFHLTHSPPYGPYFPVFECLESLMWMPDIVSAILLDAGYCYVSLNAFWLCTEIQLNILE